MRSADEMRQAFQPQAPAAPSHDANIGNAMQSVHDEMAGEPAPTPSPVPIAQEIKQAEQTGHIAIPYDPKHFPELQKSYEAAAQKRGYQISHWTLKGGNAYAHMAPAPTMEHVGEMHSEAQAEHLKGQANTPEAMQALADHENPAHPLRDLATGRAPNITGQPEAPKSTKSPHEMTPEEYKQTAQGFQNPHEQHVAQAIARGEQVPPEVLEKYPHLNAQRMLKAHEDAVKQKEDAERQKAEAENQAKQLAHLQPPSNAVPANIAHPPGQPQVDGGIGGNQTQPEIRSTPALENGVETNPVGGPLGPGLAQPAQASTGQEPANPMVGLSNQAPETTAAEVDEPPTVREASAPQVGEKIPSQPAPVTPELPDQVSQRQFTPRKIGNAYKRAMENAPESGQQAPALVMPQGGGEPEIKPNVTTAEAMPVEQPEAQQYPEPQSAQIPAQQGQPANPTPEVEQPAPVSPQSPPVAPQSESAPNNHIRASIMEGQSPAPGAVADQLAKAAGGGDAKRGMNYAKSAEYTGEALSNALGIESEHISDLVKGGSIEKTPEGRYRLPQGESEPITVQQGTTETPGEPIPPQPSAEAHPVAPGPAQAPKTPLQGIVDTAAEKRTIYPSKPFPVNSTADARPGDTIRNAKGSPFKVKSVGKGHFVVNAIGPDGKVASKNLYLTAKNLARDRKATNEGTLGNIPVGATVPGHDANLSPLNAKRDYKVRPITREEEGKAGGMLQDRHGNSWIPSGRPSAKPGEPMEMNEVDQKWWGSMNETANKPNPVAEARAANNLDEFAREQARKASEAPNAVKPDEAPPEPETEASQQAEAPAEPPPQAAPEPAAPQAQPEPAPAPSPLEKIQATAKANRAKKGKPAPPSTVTNAQLQQQASAAGEIRDARKNAQAEAARPDQVQSAVDEARKISPAHANASRSLATGRYEDVMSDIERGKLSVADADSLVDKLVKGGVTDPKVGEHFKSKFRQVSAPSQPAPEKAPEAAPETIPPSGETKPPIPETPAVESGTRPPESEPPTAPVPSKPKPRPLATPVEAPVPVGESPLAKIQSTAVKNRVAKAAPLGQEAATDSGYKIGTLGETASLHDAQLLAKRLSKVKPEVDHAVVKKPDGTYVLGTKNKGAEPVKPPTPQPEDDASVAQREQAKTASDIEANAEAARQRVAAKKGTKEPHEMSREEYTQANMPAKAMGGGVNERILARQHAIAVQKALAEGKNPSEENVMQSHEILGKESDYPPEALKQYPKLAEAVAQEKKPQSENPQAHVQPEPTPEPVAEAPQAETPAEAPKAEEKAAEPAPEQTTVRPEHDKGEYRYHATLPKDAAKHFNKAGLGPYSGTHKTDENGNPIVASMWQEKKPGLTEPEARSKAYDKMMGSLKYHQDRGRALDEIGKHIHRGMFPEQYDAPIIARDKKGNRNYEFAVVPSEDGKKFQIGMREQGSGQKFFGATYGNYDTPEAAIEGMKKRHSDWESTEAVHPELQKHREGVIADNKAAAEKAESDAEQKRKDAASRQERKEKIDTEFGAAKFKKATLPDGKSGPEFGGLAVVPTGETKKSHGPNYKPYAVVHAGSGAKIWEADSQSQGKMMAYRASKLADFRKSADELRGFHKDEKHRIASALSAINDDPYADISAHDNPNPTPTLKDIQATAKAKRAGKAPATPETAHAVGTDAGNASASEAGREKWDESDQAAAAKARNALADSAGLPGSEERPHEAEVPEPEARHSDSPAVVQMRAAYGSMKKQYPNTSIAFNHEGNLRFLGSEDAETASKVLGTPIQKDSTGTPYVEVPNTPDALKKMIAAGHKVAVAEAAGNAPKNTAVERIVGPGSLTESPPTPSLSDIQATAKAKREGKTSDSGTSAANVLEETEKAAEARAEEPASKVPTHGYDRVKMANNLSMDQLKQLQANLKNDPKNANPKHNPVDKSIYLYTPQTHKELDNIAYAITYKLNEKRKAEGDRDRPRQFSADMAQQKDLAAIRNIILRNREARGLGRLGMDRKRVGV